MSSPKPHILLMGQTPPPWHGQAVATQILFEHDWPGFEVHRLRMEFSEEMVEVGRFQWKKIAHLFHLIREARRILREHPDCVLFYPPASANWIPFIRDVIFLTNVRHLAGSTVFIFHASGLPVFCEKGILRRILSRMAYHHADVALEVSQELVSPHQVFAARSWQWCPCAIAVPERARPARVTGSPMVVLYVGSLQEGKGILEILKTASILKKRGMEKEFRFRVIGKWFSTEFEKAVRHLRTEFDLEEMVELTGQLTGDAKWDAYLSADVFFFPTHYQSEATPIVLMEALGAGLPLITTDWAGIPAMLDGCPTARLLPIKSPEAYASALIDMSGGGACADETSRESRDFYQEKFLPARFIERVEKAFRDAHAKQGSAPSMRAHADEGPKETDSACSGGVSPSLDTNADVQPATVTDRRYISDDVPDASTVTDRRYNADGDALSSPAHLTPLATSGRAEPAPPTESSTIRDPRSTITSGTSSSPSSSQRFSVSASQHLHLSVYLADQNPGHDRSYGISRMTQVVLESLLAHGGVDMVAISSKTSQQAPDGARVAHVLPWGTRSKWVRLLTDHLHPVFQRQDSEPDLHYFPKGYLPWFYRCCRPSVVTIHDTIIQYDEDHYPDWRKPRDYGYWARMLKHTLRHADYILTVSENSKRQIQAFMARHGIPRNDITVTYEPCVYERLPQPENPDKNNHVIHLASREPHKRTAHLVRWWHEAEKQGRVLPALHLIGTVPPEVEGLLASARTIVKRPFLDDSALQAAYRQAMALILPSEIEGFGLPALEAYYLGTPVCYVKGTSVEEVLAVATTKGGFALEDMESLFTALDEVMAMPPEEVRQCGLKLRDTYAADKVAERMFSVFHGVKK